MCKMFENMPGGQAMRTRVTFGRSDLIAVASHFKRKFTEFEALLAYEQQKAKKHS